MNNQTRNKVAMLGVNICFAVLNLFVKSFLAAQIYFLSGRNITAVVFFILLDITGIIVFYALSTWGAKKVNPVYIVQLSALLACLFIVLTIVYESNLGELYFVFGALWGSIQGIYWGAANFATGRAIDQSGLLGYYVWFHSLTTFASVLFPITFGFAIDYASFLITTISVFGIGLALVAFALLLKLVPQPAQAMQYRTFFRDHPRGFGLLWLTTFFGGFAYSITYLVTILILLVYGTNTHIGIFGTIFAIAAILYLFLYKWAKSSPFRKGGGAKRRGFFATTIFWLSGTLPFLIAFALLFEINPLTIILFQAGIALRNVVETEYSNARLGYCQNANGGKHIAEALVTTEFGLYAGRLLSVGVLLAVGLLGGGQMLFAGAIVFVMLGTVLYAVTLFIYKNPRANNCTLHKQTSQTRLTPPPPR